MKTEQATALRRPFPAESIGKLPKGGVMLDYVGHAAVTDRLLTVDPEWTWEPMAVDAFGNPIPDSAGNLWIRLTICGHTRIGVGDGKTMKERIGDAIRNAAMRFGVALDLWAKEDLVEFRQAVQTSGVGTPATPLGQGQPAAVEHGADTPLPVPESDKPMTAKTRGQMFALFGQKGVSDAEQLPGINHLTGKAYTSRADITEADAKLVIAALRKRPDATPQDGAA